MLPPISDPTPNTEHLALMIAPSPPELPPTALPLFQGFKVLPHNRLPVSMAIPNCGTLVCTKGIIPAFLKQVINSDYS